MFTTANSLPFASLTLSYGTSRGRDTYGYNIVRLHDNATGKVYKTIGGGYDMVGTVLADWLCDVMQQELQAIAGDAYYQVKKKDGLCYGHAQALYGMYAYYNEDGTINKVSVDGACGESSVIAIAKAIGLDVTYKTEKRRSKGFVRTGFYVSVAKKDGE